MTQAMSTEPKLLPPSAEPVPPPGMRDGDDVWYEPPVLPQPGESGYWVIKPNYDAPNINAEWPNRAAVMSPDPHLGRFEEYAEPVIWRSNRLPPKRMAEIEIGSTHTVSERVLEIFREFDPDGVKWHEVDWRFKDGALPKYRFFWMHVTRKIKAIDFANSKVLYRKRPGYPSFPVQWGPALLLNEVKGLPYFCNYPVPGWDPIFISEAMRQRMLADKIEYLKLQNLSAWPLVI